MLCKLLDSFYKNPHHSENDVYTYKINAKKNFNL